MSEAHIHFARAVGAGRSGDMAAARGKFAKPQEIERKLTIPNGTYVRRTQVLIGRLIANACLAHAESREEEAVRMIRQAVDLDDAPEKLPVTLGAILPAREQLDELLLELR